MHEFEITMDFYKDGLYKPVKFMVAVIYQSAQVERYRLTGGDKVMELEKRLNEKRQQWKILKLNFRMDVVDQWTARTLNYIYELIDAEMTGKSKVTYRPPQDRKAW